MDNEKVTATESLSSSSRLMTLPKMEMFIKVFVSFRTEWIPSVICLLIAYYVAPVSLVTLVLGGFTDSAGLGAFAFLALLVAGIAIFAGAFYGITRLIPFTFIMNTCFYLELIAKDDDIVDSEELLNNEEVPIIKEQTEELPELGIY